MIGDWAKHIDEVWNYENWREKMDDRDLYTETVQAMKSIDKDPYDIRRIGSYDGEYECSWFEFVSLADFHYDSGYGGTEVATDLIILFTDGTWMERKEYDGSEWWQYVKPPNFRKSIFDIPNEIKSLQGCGFLSDIHGEEEE